MASAENATRVRVLILWADSRSSNLGVRVLAAGTEAAVLAACPGAVVEYQSYGWGALGLSPGLRNLLLSLGPKKYSSVRKRLADYDLVVDTGAGDSFASIYGMRRLIEMSLMRRAATRGPAVVVLGPQTVGPFEGISSKLLARWSLKNVGRVFARDSVSLSSAEADLPGLTFAQSTDTVFNLPVPVACSRRDVLINVSGLLWNSNRHLPADGYRRSLKALVEELTDAGREVQLLAHVLDDPGHHDNDVAVIDEVADTLGVDREQTLIPSGLDDARRLVASANLLIGSRMHACLNAISTGTPTIPWAYSRKFLPLFADLGWPYVVELLNNGDPVKTTMEYMERLQGDDGTVEIEHIRSVASSRAASFPSYLSEVMHGR